MGAILYKEEGQSRSSESNANNARVTFQSYSAGTGSCSSGIDGFGRFIADLSIIVAA